MTVDRQGPANAGVTGYCLIGLEGAWGPMFRVTYEDPEAGEELAFLNSAEFPRPGLVTWLGCNDICSSSET